MKSLVNKVRFPQLPASSFRPQTKVYPLDYHQANWMCVKGNLVSEHTPPPCGVNISIYRYGFQVMALSRVYGLIFVFVFSLVLIYFVNSWGLETVNSKCSFKIRCMACLQTLNFKGTWTMGDTKMVNHRAAERPTRVLIQLLRREQEYLFDQSCVSRQEQEIAI